MKKKQNKKWTKFYHRIVRNILYPTLGLYARIKFRIRIEPFHQEEKRPYLILFNHQTSFDQFFVGLSFKRPVYFVATEDLFSNGFLSKIIKFLVAPIPIKKQTTDVKAVMNCIRVVKEGGAIAMAPEGNRTYSGETVYINPSVAPLARKLKVPVVLCRIEGGYGMQPRWSDVVRRGKMRSYISRVITPEEIVNLSDDELLSAIEQGLYVNEAVADAQFHHKRKAEYLERAAYVCKYCGLSEFESHGNIIECKKCHRKIEYLPNKELKGVGFDSPFKFFADWYHYQEEFINNLDVFEYTDKAMYCDTVSLYEVIPYNKKLLLLKGAKLALYGDRVEIQTTQENTVFTFDEISVVTVLGRNKLNIYHGGKIYQIKSGKRFNALKYVNIYHRYKNLKTKEKELTFLGL